MLNLEKTYSVLGERMDFLQIQAGGQELLRRWRQLEPKSRDLCDFEYGHNYKNYFSKEWCELTGFSEQDLIRVSRLGTYQFLGIPLTDEEKNLVGYYVGKVNEIRKNIAEKKGTDKEGRSKKYDK